MTALSIAHHAVPLHHDLALPRDACKVVTTDRDGSVTPAQTTPETEVHHFSVLTKSFDSGAGIDGEGAPPLGPQDMMSNDLSLLLTIPSAPPDDMPGPPILALGDGPHQDGQAQRVAGAGTTVARSRSPGGSQLQQWYTSPTVTDPFHLIAVGPHNITWQVRHEVNSKPDYHVDDSKTSMGNSSSQEDTQSEHVGDEEETEPTSKMSF
ncbi:hypothetical protein A1O7_02439 [Cladophialophora yegresii CBS 114405]|uniref:Uncharacterized protein n=1 Tax=Cladophialophora yegresii CBS 114405 TaxID=1182544 RepID=W9W1P8_9EURO|nr:uncharacterized protein A1O7_02439 [Cladophialophora yegresii CBS 114405]EXJ62007.1 hypothetical protein A1O7_02439 [Cladophialophora yegresii CBS 114405]